MVRYNNKNMGDPLYEFEQDYQIVDVDANHVPISGTEKLTRIVPTKGVAQDPTKAPISGVNIQEMELALQDLNKIDANHNITLIPANVYYTDTELINYMITNGYKDITVANTTYFEPSVSQGNLRITIGDNNKYSFIYYDLNDKLYKKSDTILTNQYLSTTLLTIANKSYIDEKDDEIKASVAVTNERLDSVVENVGAILESSSVPSVQNIAYPTVDTKLPIKTAVYTKVSNSTKLSFDDTLNYTFNLHELGTYNINLKFIIASTANRIVTIKLFKYVDGITDFLTYTWPNVTITNNQTLNVSALPFPLVKGLAGTDKYYITYAADGAGVTGQGYDLVVDLVVDQNTIPPSIGTNSVYSQGVTGHPDNTTSTVIFNDLKGRTQNQTADVNGTTFSNGIALAKVQAALPGDISNHISVYDNTNGIGFNNNAMTYVSQFNTHKFTNPSSVVYAVVKDVIDEPKSLITKEYAESNFGRTKFAANVVNVDDSGDYFIDIDFEPALPVGTTINISGWGQKAGSAVAGKTYPAFVRLNSDATAKPVAIMENTYENAPGSTSTGRFGNSSVCPLGMVYQPGVICTVFGKLTFVDTDSVSIVGDSSELPNSTPGSNLICHAHISAIRPTGGLNTINRLTIGGQVIDDIRIIVEVDFQTTPTITYVPGTLGFEIVQPDVDPEVETPIVDPKGDD